MSAKTYQLRFCAFICEFHPEIFFIFCKSFLFLLHIIIILESPLRRFYYIVMMIILSFILASPLRMFHYKIAVSYTHDPGGIRVT
jgi:hypothetical protein